MKATKLKVIIAIVGLLAAERAHPQGAFVNLDFEQAVAPLVPDAGGHVPIARALPGWTGYIGGVQVSSVWYDTRPIDAAGISVFDSLAPQQPLQPLQGNYCAWLMGSTMFAPQAAAVIAQVGQIPADAKSIRFLFSNTTYLPQLEFAGQTIPLVQLSANATYLTLGGDISSMAGGTGELRFTALPQATVGLLDGIQFSPLAVPEPTVMALSLLGILIVGRCVRRSRL
jgi:hypothetical protein